MMNKKIAVIAENRQQFMYWVRHNIIPITNRNDVERLAGQQIEKVYTEGSYPDWMNGELLQLINLSVSK